MWKLRYERKPQPEPASEADEPQGRGKLRRRAGCLWGLVTEPLALLVVTLLAAVFGRAYLVRRAQRLREREQAEQEGPKDD